LYGKRGAWYHLTSTNRHPSHRASGEFMGLKSKVAVAAVAALIPLAAVLPSASASSVASASGVTCNTEVYLHNHLSPGLYLQDADVVGGANNDPVIGQTWSLIPIPLQFCIKASSVSGFYFVYSAGTNLCLNYDASADYIRMLTCSAIASDRWDLVNGYTVGGSTQFESEYNLNDCMGVTKAGAKATIRACDTTPGTGLNAQTFTIQGF
jgi:hypothetical protein